MTGGGEVKLWQLFLSGIVTGVLLLLVLGTGYRWSNTPGFCGSCHSMERVHQTWQSSTHKQFDCAECHLPHKNFAETLAYKAKAGFHDVSNEFSRNYQVVTPLTAEAKGILQDNCARCHSSTIANTGMIKGEPRCVECHRGIVHGRGEPKGVARIE